MHAVQCESTDGEMKVAVLILLSVVCVSWGKNATLTLLTDAKEKGAVCLDGSSPGYYLRAGEGSGADKWIVHLEGGGWCANESACYLRSKTNLGSSRGWPLSEAFHGLLSDNSTVNPDFFNWNMVHVMYCDGASFAGYVNKPVYYHGHPLYFRGRKVLMASLESLMARGMRDASEVILTGCSAGGLATYLHIDSVREFLPSTTRLRGLADAGFFLDVPTISGDYLFRNGAKHLFQMQNVSGGLNQDCLKAFSEEDAWKCFFPPYSFAFIRNPVFVLNSDYDTAQLSGIVQLPCLPPNCSAEQMKFFNQFRVDFLQQASAAINSPTTGIFIDSCLIHCQALFDTPWQSYKVGNQTMRGTFSDWYFGTSSPSQKSKELDCKYPCNPTCRQTIQSDNL